MNEAHPCLLCFLLCFRGLRHPRTCSLHLALWTSHIPGSAKQRSSVFAQPSSPRTMHHLSPTSMFSSAVTSEAKISDFSAGVNKACPTFKLGGKGVGTGCQSGFGQMGVSIAEPGMIFLLTLLGIRSCPTTISALHEQPTQRCFQNCSPPTSIYRTANAVDIAVVPTLNERAPFSVSLTSYYNRPFPFVQTQIKMMDEVPSQRKKVT